MLSTEPVDLQIDPTTGDLVVDSDLHWTTGVAGITQGIRIALQMFKGEWFLDLDEGIPYLERSGVAADEALIGQKFNQSRAVSMFREAILRAPGVNTITSLAVSFDHTTRKITATWVVQTAFGDTPPETLALGV